MENLPAYMPKMTKMTLDEFYTKLTEYPAEWHEGFWAGSIRTGKNPDPRCPITFLAEKMLNVKYSIEDAREAGYALGLNREDALAIISSADAVEDPFYNPAVRAKLIEITKVVLKPREEKQNV